MSNSDFARAKDNYATELHRAGEIYPADRHDKLIGFAAGWQARDSLVTASPTGRAAQAFAIEARVKVIESVPKWGGQLGMVARDVHIARRHFYRVLLDNRTDAIEFWPEELVNVDTEASQ